MPMTCQEFLARHSDYVDGVLEAEEAVHWAAHVSTCPRCARYDRLVRDAQQLVRRLPEVEPSHDFFPRLQHRIYNLEDELRDRRPAGIGAMLSIAVAGTLAVLAWSPLLRWGLEVGPGVPQASITESAEADALRSPVDASGAARRGAARTTAPAAAGAVQLAAESDRLPAISPIGAPDDWRPGPSLSPWSSIEQGWWAGSPGLLERSPLAPASYAVDFTLPGPYSPLIVDAPLYRRKAIFTRTSATRTGRD